MFDVEPEAATLRNESRFLDALFARVDEQKVDMLLIPRGSEPGPFARLVLRDAVPLW